MFCKYCGKPIKEGLKFCQYCGKPTNRTPSEAEEETAEEVQELKTEEMGEELNEEEEVPEQSVKETNPPKSKKTRSQAVTHKEKKPVYKAVWIVSIILIILALGGGGYLLYNRSQINKETEAFGTKITAFEETMEDYDLDDSDEYEDLIDKCEAAKAAKEVESYSALEEELKTAQKEAKALYEYLQTVPQMKANYEAGWVQDIATSEESSQYNLLMLQLETAAAHKDKAEIEKTCKAIESLEASVFERKKADIKNKVADLEANMPSSATSAQKALMEDYSSQINTFLDEGNYGKIAEVLAKWEKMREDIINTAANKTASAVTPPVNVYLYTEDGTPIQSPNNTGSAGSTNNSPKTYTRNDFVFYDSDSRYLSKSELTGLSQGELLIARNEIYARKGRKFVNQDLQDYFNSQYWYSGTVEANAFSDSMLNKYEKSNAALIKDYERSMGYVK